MSNYNNLKSAVAAVIRTNGNNGITAAKLYDELERMIDTLGSGYQFMGLATPSTNPGTPDQRVFYIAGPGEYPNFGHAAIENGRIGILRYDTQWRVGTLAFSLPNGDNPGQVMYFDGTDWLPFDERDLNVGKLEGFSKDAFMFALQADYVSATAPASPSAGTTWIDTANNKFKTYNVYSGTGVWEENAYKSSALGNDNVYAYSITDEVWLFKSQGEWKNIDAIRTSDLGTYNIVEPKNWFNYNDSDYVEHKYVYHGALFDSGDYNTSGFIPVKQGESYKLMYGTGKEIASIRFVELYDSDKRWTRALANVRDITPEEGEVYVRFSSSVGYFVPSLLYPEFFYGDKPDEYTEYFQPYTEFVLKQNIVRTENIAGGAVTTPKIADGAVTKEKAAFVGPINLVNLEAEDVALGKYVYQGVLDDSTTLNTTGFIPVDPNTHYCLKASDKDAQIRFVEEYNDSKSYISGSSKTYVNAIDTSNSTKYIRITYNVVWWQTSQVTETAQAIPFTAYQPNFIKGLNLNGSDIASHSITKDKLASGIHFDVTPNKFDTLSSDIQDILSNGYITTPFIHGHKNTAISVSLHTLFEQITFGVGRDGFYQGAIVLDDTDVKYITGTAETVAWTAQHGLTFDENTTILIDRPLQSSASKITIYNGQGESWSRTFNFSGQGRPFLENNGVESIVARLDYQMKDINQKIWLFGDSYFSYESNARWPYYLFQDGYTSNLLSAQGGDATGDALQSFQSLLATGARPSYAVWCMGMNGAADSGTTPNATWLADTQSFLTLCETYGITPILATIPSVPSLNHAGRIAWVRASNYRYIDFAVAVEVDENTSWKNWGNDKAMLSSDEVHPTAYGAKALYQQVLRDFPELTIII